ncbi:hypothetical protein LDENG_00244290 [Lucifuga dentata]|nr:hypothetical protein LDENG_00244290 [Lucifuga dentata]
MVVVDKEQKRTILIDVAVPADSNIRKKEHQKIQKYQGLKEELERTWKVKSKVVPVVIGALGAVTPKLGEWLQEIPGTTSEVSVQKSAVLGTAKILQNPQTPRPLHTHTHIYTFIYIYLPQPRREPGLYKIQAFIGDRPLFLIKDVELQTFPLLCHSLCPSVFH